jgi:hypothetical protein
MRIGSLPNGRPIFADLSIIMHRKLPADSRIKYVYLIRRKHGERVRWELQFVLTQKAWVSPHTLGHGEIGLDVGWRRFDDRLRVAVYRDEGGVEKEISIPNNRLYWWRKSNEVQGRRDNEFNAIRAAIVAWKQADGSVLPQWFLGETWSLAQWRKKAKLHELIDKWREMTIEGDAEIFAQAEAWAKHDRHLRSWQHSLVQHALRWRKDFYRKTAVELRRQFSKANVESVNWHRLKRKKGPESEEIQLSRFYSDVVSVGKFLDTLKATMPYENKTAALTTKVCAKCNTKNTFDAARYVSHTCEGCGEVWDQDGNAAENLLDPQWEDRLKGHQGDQAA